MEDDIFPKRWERFFSYHKMVPGWFGTFEKDPKKALVDLFSGRTPDYSMAPADPNFPEEALADWVLTIQGENDFSATVDTSISALIEEEPHNGNSNGNKKQRVLWRKILAFFSNKEIQKLLPNSTRILHERGRKFFQNIVAGDSNSLLVEHVDKIFEL